MGGTVAVKKALLAIAQRLQYRSQMEKAEFLPQHSLSLPTLAGNSVDYSPSPILGDVIGKGASYVKALERETGASIKLAASVAWAKERVATISALENPGPLYSPAQIATIRVFDRSIDIGVEMGVVPGTGKGDTVSARLLVTLKEVACLVDDGGKVASDISSVSVVKMQLLLGDHALHCSAEFDKVLKVQLFLNYKAIENVLDLIVNFVQQQYTEIERESITTGRCVEAVDRTSVVACATSNQYDTSFSLSITGAYENVKSALFQVTDRLGDNMSSSIEPHVASSMHFPHSSLNISPYECEEITSPSDKEMTLTQ
ncbi:hypothetical protein LguiB_018722 [Lonicera macranthoides]